MAKTQETVTIKGVDTDLLEEQRLALVSALMNEEILKKLEPTQIDLLDGLQNMLDSWSDERYYAQNKG